MINEGCGLLGTGDGIAWNGGRRGTGFFFAETLKRWNAKRKKPARRPGGFAIRRQKMFDLLKPGDL